MRILVHGATGRMGRAVIKVAAQDPHVVLAAAVSRPDHPLVGVDAGEQAGVGSCGVHVGVASDAMEDIDVVIDFTNAQGFDDAVALAQRLDAALVSGSTGLSVEQFARLDALAHHQPVLWAPNMSPAITLLQQLIEQAAAVLPDADIEILELHHRHKKDAPSGTAWSLAERAAHGRHQSVSAVVNRQRADQPAERRSGEIGIAVQRGGDVAGEHRVGFYLDGELLELTHRATSRDIFARGALRAGHWIINQSPARYLLNDVIREH